VAWGKNARAEVLRRIEQKMAHYDSQVIHVLAMIVLFRFILPTASESFVEGDQGNELVALRARQI